MQLLSWTPFSNCRTPQRSWMQVNLKTPPASRDVGAVATWKADEFIRRQVAAASPPPSTSEAGGGLASSARGCMRHTGYDSNHPQPIYLSWCSTPAFFPSSSSSPYHSSRPLPLISHLTTIFPSCSCGLAATSTFSSPPRILSDLCPSTLGFLWPSFLSCSQYMTFTNTSRSYVRAVLGFPRWSLITKSPM